MCGITGIWNLNGKPVSRDTITRYNNTLKHRGPDGGDVYVNNNLALGHRRLSILDLSEMGNQPMIDEELGLVIVYNGEVYNYVELKKELQLKGYNFKTRTDTEVLLAAYKEWGEDCVFRFNGMWAFAIWDISKKTLFVSRDRFGVKPLYYIYKKNEIFAFSSETISFSELDGFNKTFSTKNLNLGIRFSFYLESVGETIYNDIVKLKPGHNITFKHGKDPVIKKWWSTEKHLVMVSGNYHEQVEQFHELLIDSCKLRLRSDVSVGTALSGGLDSSSIYCLIKELQKKNLFDAENTPADWQTAFVASFPGTTMDEKEYADEVIKYTNGQAKYIYPKDDNITNAIISEVKHEDYIYLSPPVVHNIYREMRNNGVKVSLDGHGVDEMLFGYPNMVSEWMVKENDEATKRMLCTTMAGLLNENEDAISNKYLNHKTVNRTLIQRLLDSLPQEIKLSFRKRAFNKTKQNEWMRELYQPVEPDSPGRFTNPSYSIPYRKFHVDVLPTLLRNWDAASMRHGVEIRMPFMDWRLVTYVFSLPGSSKVGEGYTKHILRDAMKELMPENIRTRKYKIGINAPMVEWFNHELSSFIKDAVSSRSFLESGVWNGPLLKEHALKLTNEKKWTQNDCNVFWPYLNAWILMQ